VKAATFRRLRRAPWRNPNLGAVRIRSQG
jgi:hypothetical protein